MEKLRQFINKIFALLCSIGMDRYQHFSFGAIMGCTSAMAFCWLPLWAILIVSVLSVFTIAIGKEIYDDYIDWWDFVVTMCGGALIWITLLLSLIY